MHPLLKWLKRRKISIKEFARRTTVAEATVHRIIEGKAPNLSTAARIVWATHGEVGYEHLLPKKFVRKMKPSHWKCFYADEAA